MLSKQSLDILIDLVEIKLSTIMVQDKDDIREVRRLRNCRNELVISRKGISKSNHRCQEIGKSIATGHL